MLLTASDVAELLRVTPGIAKSLLVAWAVPCVDLGPGRGRGKRWARRDVEEAANRAKGVAVAPGRAVLDRYRPTSHPVRKNLVGGC